MSSVSGNPLLEEEREEKEKRGNIYTFLFPDLTVENPYKLLPLTAPAVISSRRLKRQRAVTDYKALYNTGVKREGKRQ
jgi:hypothetical protein